MKISIIFVSILLFLFPTMLFSYEPGELSFGPTPGYAARGAVKTGGGEIYYFTTSKICVGPTVQYLIFKPEFDDDSAYEWKSTVLPCQFGMRYYFYQMIFLGLGAFYTVHLETETTGSVYRKDEYNTYGPYAQFGFRLDFGESFYLEVFSQLLWGMNTFLKVNSSEEYMRIGIAQIAVGIKIQFGSEKKE